MSHTRHTEVISSLYSKFESARSSGTLLFYPSTQTKVKEHGFNYEITICPALQKKPTQPAPDFSRVDESNPFAPPYEPDLFLGELKDELEGDEYAVLLNKFSIIPGHFVMVAKGFQSQNSPLTPPDLTQAYLLIRASQKSDSPIFAFYNCGVDSGASQPHKHIQFIPTTRIEADDDDEHSRPPVEEYVEKIKLEDDTRVFALPLPYTHFVQKLQLPKATVSGTKPLSEEALQELSGTLTRTFLGLLDEAIQSVRLHRNSQATTTRQAEPGHTSTPSYNIILTSEHMHLIPRLQEKTAEVLQPHGEAKVEDGTAAYTPKKLSVNSLGFAGMLLAKSDLEAQAIKTRGVVDLLTQVGVPNTVEKPEDASESAI